MVIDNEALKRGVNNYIHDVTSRVAIDKVYLYGSYANGTPNEWSDVDICFFSVAFNGKRSVDILPMFYSLARKYQPDICFEPRVFPTSELNNDNPFVKEIINTGYEIKKNA
jgi:predicted nucleotidyltransferase